MAQRAKCATSFQLLVRPWRLKLLVVKLLDSVSTLTAVAEDGRRKLGESN